MQAGFYHTKGNELHPFPGILRDLIARFFEDTGRGFFCSGEYDEVELAWVCDEEGRKITDGKQLRDDCVAYWSRYYREIIADFYGDEVAEAFGKW